MVPIYEQGGGHGIGYGAKSFLARFDQICREHIAHKRAKAFAFIFYDFTDGAIQALLNDQGVFAKLDRLSASELSVFYLHAAGERRIKEFNAHLMNKLGLGSDISLPCVVFFKLEGEGGFRDFGIRDIAVVQIENSDVVHSFQELNDIIKEYLASEATQAEASKKPSRFVVSAIKFISVEALDTIFSKALDYLF